MMSTPLWGVLWHWCDLIVRRVWQILLHILSIALFERCQSYCLQKAFVYILVRDQSKMICTFYLQSFKDRKKCVVQTWIYCLCFTLKARTTCESLGHCGPNWSQAVALQAASVVRLPWLWETLNALLPYVQLDSCHFCHDPTPLSPAGGAGSLGTGSRYCWWPYLSDGCFKQSYICCCQLVQAQALHTFHAVSYKSLF